MLNDLLVHVLVDECLQRDPVFLAEPGRYRERYGHFEAVVRALDQLDDVPEGIEDVIQLLVPRLIEAEGLREHTQPLYPVIRD